MEQIIRGLLAMAQMQFEEAYKELNLSESVRVSTDSNKVKIELTHPSEEIFQIITGRKMDSIFSMSEFDALS
jgi:hypothetical protein